MVNKLTYFFLIILTGCSSSGVTQKSIYLFDDFPNGDELQGVFVNSFDPEEDTLIFQNGFIFITVDSTGKRQLVQGTKISSYHFDGHGGPATVSLFSINKIWDFQPHFINDTTCSRLLVLEGFRESDLIQNKTDSTKNEKWKHLSDLKNRHGHEYRFVQCYP